GRPLLGRATARSRLWRSSFAVLATASLPGGVPGQPSSSPRADAASRAVLGRLAQRLPSRPALRAPVRLSLGPAAAGRRGRLQPGGVGVFRAAGTGGPLLRRQPVGPPRLALARLAGLRSARGLAGAPDSLLCRRRRSHHRPELPRTAVRPGSPSHRP